MYVVDKKARIDIGVVFGFFNWCWFDRISVCGGLL